MNAVAAIAPPTDLANWGKPGFILTEEPQMAVFIPALGFDLRSLPKNVLRAAPGCERRELRRRARPNHASRLSLARLLALTALAQPRASGGVPTPSLRNSSPPESRG